MTTTLHQLTEDQAIQLALEIERAEAALKQMKVNLKAYVDEKGPLQAGDQVWNNYGTISWGFGADSLKELAVAITAEGKNAWEFLTLPAASLKKLGWDDDSLAQYGTLKESKRFGSRKA
ncbi:hypothetical protein [Paenibacillus massiliensis]|uniref:hypothetical protein n=1 Tax=Paenibacillus massiliensis TaxID=225917 RepID=UPI00040A3E01|nr:hypothetical protein [Paenibacillus massiliensis]